MAETETSPSTRKADPSPLHNKRIGIVGTGAMGSALCRGLVQTGAVNAGKILVYDPHTEHVRQLQESLGVRVAESNAQIARFTDIVLIALKPYAVAAVLEEIAEALQREEGKPPPLLISIAAGVSSGAIESLLKGDIPVIRAMPNTPAQLGCGACAFCTGTYAADEHKAMASAIFDAVGISVEVSEQHMNAVTALSGSGPAYVYLMIEALADGGVKVGLPRDTASRLAAQTVLGAARMVLETGLHPAQLRDMVATPAGTTITAIAALEHSGVRAALIDAVERAEERAAQLDWKK